MITLDIVNLLKNDTRLKAIKGLKIKPYATDNKKAIVYTVTPGTSDKIKETYTLKLVAISESMAEVEQIIDIAKDIILTLGDEQLNNRILKVVQNGGSNMFNYETGTYHIGAYFNITSKGDD